MRRAVASLSVSRPLAESMLRVSTPVSPELDAAALQQAPDTSSSSQAARQQGEQLPGWPGDHLDSVQECPSLPHKLRPALHDACHDVSSSRHIHHGLKAPAPGASCQLSFIICAQHSSCVLSGSSLGAVSSPPVGESHQFWGLEPGQGLGHKANRAHCCIRVQAHTPGTGKLPSCIPGDGSLGVSSSLPAGKIHQLRGNQPVQGLLGRKVVL